MATYKRNLHLGTKDPLIESDDIAGGAIVWEHLSEDVKSLFTELAEKMESVTEETLACVNGGEYDKDNKTLVFKHDDDELFSIDCTSFIKDGMVESVTIEDSNLIITFNTDAGTEAITIPLSEVFSLDDYYTKEEVDALIVNGGIPDNVALVDSVNVTAGEDDVTMTLVGYDGVTSSEYTIPQATEETAGVVGKDKYTSLLTLIEERSEKYQYERAKYLQYISGNDTISMSLANWIVTEYLDPDSQYDVTMADANLITNLYLDSDKLSYYNYFYNKKATVSNKAATLTSGTHTLATIDGKPITVTVPYTDNETLQELVTEVASCTKTYDIADYMEGGSLEGQTMPVGLYTYEGYPVSQQRYVNEAGDSPKLVICLEQYDTYEYLGLSFVLFTSEDGLNWTYSESYSNETVPSWISKAFGENIATQSDPGRMSAEDKTTLDELSESSVTSTTSGLKIEIVSEMPETPDENTIYIVE